MPAEAPLPLVPAEISDRVDGLRTPDNYLIVVAMRDPVQAQQCVIHLAQAGYAVVVCPAEVTPATVIATVEVHRPDLLMIDDDIDWAEDAHVILRLHADPDFATLSVLLLPERRRIPQWYWHDTYPVALFLTKPFTPQELINIVNRLHKHAVENDVPASPIPPFPSKRTEADWQIWTQQLPPLALFAAAEEGDQARVERLLMRGANVRAQNRRGWSALHIAAHRGHPRVVSLLLQAEADVDARTNKGATPLWYAADRAEVEVMRLLLERGADPHAAGSEGETPLGRAQKHGMSKMPSDIVRLDLRPRSGLFHWYLCGLNIFTYNDVACPIEQRPDVVFLTELTSRLSCAVHVSSLVIKDRVDAPEEMFGPSDGPTPYFRSRVGFHDIFYDLNEWPSWDACVFPRVTPLFWHALLREEGDLNALIGDHGLALYVAPISDTTEELERLLAAPFPGEAEWLQSVCALYALVVTVGHDGQFLHLYTHQQENLHLIEPALQSAVGRIETSEWFQAHQQELVWDELWCCLRVPE